MPEVQNVGTVDYAQYQPSQTAEADYTQYAEAPEVYDEHAEQMKAASKSRAGAKALATIAIASLALWGGHAWGKKAAAAEIEKAKDAVANYKKAQQAMAEAEKIADENAGKFFGKNRVGRNFYEKLKELFSPFKKAAEETKEEVKEGAEKAADDVKDAAEELAEKASDSAK